MSLLRSLLVAASKKSTAKKQLNRETPSTEEGVDVVHNIFGKEINTLNRRTLEDALKMEKNGQYTPLVLDLTLGKLWLD